VENLKWRFCLLPFIQASLSGVFLCSVAQTQINLYSLQSLGVRLPLGDRFQSTIHDLLNFAPIFFGLFSPGFLISQLFVLLLVRQIRSFSGVVLFPLGSALSLWLAIKVLDMVAPTSGLIYAAIDPSGLLILLVCAAIAGLVFYLSLSKRALFVKAAPAAFLLVLMGGVFAPGDGWANSGYQVTTLTNQLVKPWSMAFLPDGRALITEKPGRLRWLSADGKLDPKPIDGVPEVYFQGQGGLLEVLPSFDFESSRFIYLSYSCGTGAANHTCVAKGQLNEYRLINVQEIFRSQFAKKGGAHFGGRMVWLADNTLVLTLGDGYSYRADAQNLENHLGSLVRLNPDGSVPADNPFLNDKKAKPEIYSYGHRNVQGLFFDRRNNRLYEHEHGARGGDEINLIEPGRNYGWPLATYGVDYTGAQITPYQT
jgi:aldose sugar dehydrogenase